MAETSPLVALFGDVLVSQNEKVNTASLASHPYIMIYFSAHWCPPCRAFTPELATYYKKHKEAFNFELVFVSWDKTEQNWKEYYDTMPWLALPFDQRDIQKQLSKKFKVEGIPTLVVIDNQGNVITTKGRGQVTQAPTQFPWKPKTFAEIFSGEAVNSAGDKISLQSLKDKKSTVGIYFSAHWCPPCRKFTPALANTYKALKAKDTNFEVLFVSSDRKQDDFKEYLGEMPWYTLGFQDPRGNELSDLFDVESLPTLFIVEAATGKVINDDGRTSVSNDPQGNDFPWQPKLVNPVEYSGKYLNSDVCFLYLDSSVNEEQINALKNAASSVSASLTSANKDLKFFYWSNKPIVGQIRDFTSVRDDPVILILDINQNNMWVVNGKVTTEEGFKSVVTQYVEGKLTSKKIKDE